MGTLMSPPSCKFNGDLDSKSWTGKVKFCAESSETNGSVTRDVAITCVADKAHSELMKCIDPKEEIRIISVYKVPLQSSPKMSSSLFHEFLVLATNRCYWSFERNAKEIVIQRGKKLNNVKSWCGERQRKAEQKEDFSKSVRLNMGDFVAYLHREEILNTPYNLIAANCQHFAEEIFNYIARSETRSSRNRTSVDK